MSQALILGAVGASLLYSYLNQDTKPNMGTVEGKSEVKKEVKVSPVVGNNTVLHASVEGMESRKPFQSCVEKEGAWLSSNLLPKQKATMDNKWSVYAPTDVTNKNFLAAGHHYGVNTVGSSLRNANMQLRSEPVIPKKSVSPFLNSSIDPDTTRRQFDIQDF